MSANHAHVVVDASVAVKWVIEEPGTEAALALRNEGVLHAPDFMLVEVANVFWSKVRRRLLTRAQADGGYEAIASVPFLRTPLAELVLPARSTAFALDVTVYDAVYVALAQRWNCPLATADGKLAQAMEASGVRPGALLIT